MQTVSLMDTFRDAAEVVRENRDDYPLTNIRWTYVFLFFVALPAVVGMEEGDPFLAVGSAVAGIGMCVFISLGMYGMEQYEESLIARLTLAVVVSVFGTVLVGFVGFLALIVLAGVLTIIPISPLNAAVVGLFLAFFIGTLSATA